MENRSSLSVGLTVNDSAAPDSVEINPVPVYLLAETIFASPLTLRRVVNTSSTALDSAAPENPNRFPNPL